MVLLDQTRLPGELNYLACSSVDELADAIKRLAVRGAPAIGIAAAYGICLAARAILEERGDQAADPIDSADQARLHSAADQLAATRPTAVNLDWALARMRAVADAAGPQASVSSLAAQLLNEARAIHEEDRQMCRAIGEHGAALIQDGSSVLTHCNAGGLATSEYGTALAVIFAAHEQGKSLHVYVDETRPLLQGARLTAWELLQRDIDATLICDSVAAEIMRQGLVRAVVTGADRIAANGDVANKIGTYGVALLAAAHGIPFYVAAPTSSFDLSLPTGSAIPIEERPAAEITDGFGTRTAPEGIAVFNPAFDITPAHLVAALICEHGVIRPVNVETIRATLGSPPQP